MNLLLDTHLLLWAAGEPEKLSSQAKQMIADARNELWFSVASMWEISIKKQFSKSELNVDCNLLRRGLLENGYNELTINSHHAIDTGKLPPIHRDPFDRLLVSQAEAEGFLLLTSDRVFAEYPGPIRLV